MKYKSTLLCFFLASVFTLAQEEIIVLETPTGKIEGTLLLPSNETPPVVLIIAGSGPTDRDGNSPGLKMDYLKMLAEGLNQHNIASIRYDKRGIGASRIEGFNEDDLRFSHYIDDVKLWISKIRDDTRFGDIIVIGHSEGSLIGMIASQDTSPNKFISIALAFLFFLLPVTPHFIFTSKKPRVFFYYFFYPINYP